MNRLQILDNEMHIVIEVTNSYPDKDQQLEKHVGLTDRSITIPMPQMIRLLKNAFIKTNPTDHLIKLKNQTTIDVNETNNIGHLRLILRNRIEDIDYLIQCEKILIAFNKNKERELI